MKLCAIALDYDGTIAREGILDADVKTAIAEVRSRGVAVVLVTGRILEELRQLIGDFALVDGVVAENGAVLAFPDGYSRLIGRPAPAIFLEGLRRRGIEFKAGQCVVETDANSSPQVLALIRELELPLALLFNRGRLMVLPQAISKSTGLREALTMLRLSAHNTIAIGDAENDNDLLDACELGVAVAWGSKVLQANADEVLPGDEPNAVAGYIQRAAMEMRLPPERIGRNRVVLGTTEDDGSPLALAKQGRNLLIAGEPRSGKSWLAGLECEQLILQGYSLCVIDAEGDYRTLESLPGVVVFGGDNPAPDLPDLTRVLRHPHMSAVVDLSHVPYREKIDYLNEFLPMLASLRRRTGLPHRIVIDEAHYFLHESNVKELLDLDLGAYTLITYRLSDLHCNLRKAIQGIIVKRTTDPVEVQTLVTMAAGGNLEFQWKTILAGLAIDEAVLLPGIEEAGAQMRRFRLSPRMTGHVRHKSKYLDLQLPSDRAFVFTENGRAVGIPACTLEEFISSLKTLPLSVLDGHARRGDFSNWIGDMFHDHLLASEVRKVEHRYRLGHTRDLYRVLAERIQERYELSSPVTIREDSQVTSLLESENAGGL